LRVLLYINKNDEYNGLVFSGALKDICVVKLSSKQLKN
jgi:hypothetical protein